MMSVHCRSCVCEQGCGTHHKVAVHHLLMEEASQGLEHLSHGAVSNNDHALSCQALREVAGVHGMEIASMRPENLPEFLHITHSFIFSSYASVHESAALPQQLYGIPPRLATRTNLSRSRRVLAMLDPLCHTCCNTCCKV